MLKAATGNTHYSTKFDDGSIIKSESGNRYVNNKCICNSKVVQRGSQPKTTDYVGTDHSGDQLSVSDLVTIRTKREETLWCEVRPDPEGSVAIACQGELLRILPGNPAGGHDPCLQHIGTIQDIEPGTLSLFQAIFWGADRGRVPDQNPKLPSHATIDSPKA